MQILSALGDKTEYTWDQTWRFFLIGALKACGYAAIPVIIAAWHNYENYTDATDWSLVTKLGLSGIGLSLYSYWTEHKALLRMPPIWAIPEDFEPSKTTIERSTHTTTVTKETEAGTTTTKIISPHTSTTTIKPAELDK